MTRVMVTLTAPERAPTLSELLIRFGLSEADVDPSFGVVLIDPEAHLYALRVEESAAAKFRLRGDDSVKGIYSDPPIAPFGPPSRR